MKTPTIEGKKEFINQTSKEAIRIENSLTPIAPRTNKAIDSLTPIFPKKIDGANIVSKYTCQIAAINTMLISSPNTNNRREN